MSNKYSKRNYVEVVQKITPGIYKEEDLKLALEEEDLSLKILRGDAELIEKFATSLNPLVSSIDLSSYWEWETSSLMSRRVLAGFIKQNKLTRVTQESFNLEILVPLGYSLGDYDSSSSLKTFLSGTLFPKINIGKNTQQHNSIQELTSEVFGKTREDTFTYLSKSLGLLYLCIYDREDPNISPLDSLILDLMASNLYIDKPIETIDIVSIFKEAIWSASGTIPAMYPNFLIPEFVSGTGLWTSGTQGLEKLKTWTNILYSEMPSDKDDTFVKDYFTDYFDKGITQTSIEKRGPLYKFNQAFGFLLADINNQVVSLETLNSIEDCPKEYLPYLADLLGWEFYTSNVDSWRRQLREARSLLQKKGTKQGLIDLLEVILPAAHIDFENNFSEYFESYIPNLIYYLLKTSSSKFEDNCTWDQKDADEHACGEWDPSNLDNSIRFVIDHILLEAVQKYPYLFNIDGYPFRLDSSSFVFNYRDRDFSIPPWEYEKFYKNCDLIDELVEFFAEKLICLGCPVPIAKSFENYILDNTIRGYQKPELYGNSFLFLTETLNLAPNYDSIMENFEKTKFDYLPLWSGKSSQFNLTVSSGNMDDGFFVQSSFTTEDFFEALKSIKSFIPAKTIKRVHVDLEQTDSVFQYSKMQPRLTMPTVDFANPSGAMASFESSTLNMRHDSLGLLGRHTNHNPTFDFGSPRTVNNHQDLPVFQRDRLKFGRVSTENAYVDTSSVFTASGPYEVVQPRSSGRRRNFEKNLSKGQYFNRLGFNQPTFLNRTEERTDGITTDFLTLGLIPSSNSFQTIDSVHDLPKVYLTCEHKDSPNVIDGAKTSLCFNTRGTELINIDSEESHPYRFRDNLEDIHDFIFKHVDKRLFLQAKLTIELNSHMVGNSYWKDNIISLKNKLWNDYDFSLENDFHNIKLDNNEMIPLERDRGINYLYLNDYVKNGRHPLAQTLLDDLDLGGSSLLSHVYGPIFWNGHLTMDGSGINQPNKYKKNTELGQEYEFDILASGISGIDYYGLDFNLDLEQEYATFSFLSGVEIVSRGGKNKVSLYNLSSDEGFIPKTSPLLNKNLLTLKNRSGMQRIKFPFETLATTPEHTGSFYGEEENFLTPEHNFSVTTSSIHLREGTFLAGGGSVRLWIRTLPEDINGEKVIWVYTPDEEWRMYPTSYFEAKYDKKSDWSNLLNTCHTFTHNNKNISRKEGCNVSNTTKDALFHLDENDMEKDRVSFDTLNRNISVPMDYYVKHQQVHRKDQKYVIEVFGDASVADNQYWAFGGINAVDETMAYRSSLKFKFNLPDYTLSNKTTDKSVEFFKENGDAVPLGSRIYVNLKGEVFLGNDKLTMALRGSGNKPRLYCTVNALVKTFGNGEYFFIRFEGFITVTDYNLGSLLNSLETFNYTLTYFDYYADPYPKNFFTEETESLDFSRLGSLNDPAIHAHLPDYTEGDPITLSSYGIHTIGEAADLISEYPHWWPANPNLARCNHSPINGSTLGPTVNPYCLPWDTTNPEPIFAVNAINEVNPFSTSSTVLSCTGISIGDIRYVGHVNSYIKEYTGEFQQNPRFSNWPITQQNQFGHPEWINFDLSSLWNEHNRDEDDRGPYSTPYWEENVNLDYPPLPYLDRIWWGHNVDGAEWFNGRGFIPPDYDGHPGVPPSPPPANDPNSVWVVYTLAFNPNDSATVNCDKVLLGISKGLKRPHHHEELFFRAIYDRESDSVEHALFNEDGDNYLSTPEIREHLPWLTDNTHLIQSGVFPLGDWRLMYLAVNKAMFNHFSFRYEPWGTFDIGERLIEVGREQPKMSIGLLKKAENGLSNASLKIAKMTAGYRPNHSRGWSPYSLGHLFRETDFFVRTSSGEVGAFIEGNELGSLIKKEVNHTEKLEPTELLDLFRYFNNLSNTSEGRDINNSQSYHGYNGGGRSNYRVHPGPYDTGTYWDGGKSQVDGVNLTN